MLGAPQGLQQLQNRFQPSPMGLPLGGGWMGGQPLQRRSMLASMLRRRQQPGIGYAAS
jgi:hypothetical protein